AHEGAARAAGLRLDERLELKIGEEARDLFARAGESARYEALVGLPVILAHRFAAPALRPAICAFDALAPVFDARFGEWRSVAAQRNAVRRALLDAFPEGASLLELGGGTGEGALFLAACGRRVLTTDGAPA